MDKTGIYSKTPKGLEEIARRALKLPPKLRQVLIMVDGRSDAATLAKQLDTLGDVAGYLNTLAHLGLIGLPEDASTTHSPAAPAAPGPADLSAARRDISQMIVDGLGPDADMLTLKIEVSRTREELIRHCKICRSIMERVLGKARGDEFWTRASQMLA